MFFNLDDLFLPLLGILFVLFMIVGSTLGWISVIRLRRVNARLRDVETKLALMPRAQAESVRPTAPSVAPATSAMDMPSSPPRPAPRPVPVPAPVLTAAPSPILAPAPAPSGSFELQLGTRWLRYAGIVMFLAGVAFFLQYTYSRGLVPPIARLAIGVLTGAAMLVVGEYWRLRWRPLFTTLTGGGLGVFYLCTYFSFQVYELVSAEASFGAAILVTLMALALAVRHDAIAIAIFGVAGGFMSPVFLSSGGNHPHELFLYVLCLDALALGVAYFRRWLWLDVLCFAGTVFLYLGWFGQYYSVEQMPVALAYVTAFYLVFLVLPFINGLAHKRPRGADVAGLVLANAVFSVGVYYRILHADYRLDLGAITIVQALAVLGMFRLWGLRVATTGPVAESLLGTALALALLAVPFTLNLYGIPIAWGVQAAVLAYFASRFKHATAQIGSLAAAALAIGGVLDLLPMHRAAFVPVMNGPFLSWLCVAAGIAVAAYLYHRFGGEDRAERVLGSTFGVAAFGVLAMALSAEVWNYCRYVAPPEPTPWQNAYISYTWSAELLLWSLLALSVFVAAHLTRQHRLLWFAVPVCAIGAALFVSATLHAEQAPSIAPFANRFAWTALVYIAVLYAGGYVARRLDAPSVLSDTAGHIVLALLIWAQFELWQQTLATSRFGEGMISAGWAIEAAVLLWIGLALRWRAWRIMGLVLFGAAIFKAIVFDMSGLDPVYRIASFIGTGALLLAGTYLYQRYAARLTEPRGEEQS